ncbi:C40 family peptidase [Aestuariispira ectoiniformans]|uniref:C40 family peptidase n=1 Tax=Aestuariispira ectoiniformans TaxID=2775080 RepID=UPI00223BE4C1|nr:C40 family peptidase [Aestuariispira ectoiniformans]
MEKLDRRLFAFRDDLADSRLVELVSAERFVEGVVMQVSAPSLTLRRGPEYSSPQDCELIHGDQVRVFDAQNGWSWVQNLRDDYVGYVPTIGLTESVSLPTHRVTALSSFIFPEPDMKLHPNTALPLTSLITVEEVGEKYSRLASGGWIYNRHITPIQVDAAGDPVATARLFLGVPYFWGGNTSHGIDCSGLVQVAMRHCGLDVPRDTDLQEQEIGEIVPFDGSISDLERGDLVFWPGHVGFYEGDGMLLHANATDMMVASAPLEQVRAHVLTIEKHDISSIRRIPSILSV